MTPRRPSTWRAVAAITRTDLTRLARDRVALFFIVVLPIVIIVIIGASSGSGGDHTPMGVVDLDHSAESADLITGLRDSGVVEVRNYDAVDEMTQDIRIQNVVGGVSIPVGYGATLERGETGTVTLLADQKQQATVALTSVLRNTIDRQGQVLAAGQFAAAQTGRDRAGMIELARAEQQMIKPIGVEVDTTGREALDSTNRYAYTAPSNLVLFVFINSVTGASALVESRRLGVTRRMLSAPLDVRAILLGVGCTRMLIAVAQSALIIAVGTAVFGVSWGQPLGVAALVLVFALLSTGAGLLVGALVEKPEQVPALGIPISLGLAMLGGCMWPLEIVPPALQTAGHFTPHAWAMDAWISLGFEGGTITTIARPLLILGATAAALLSLAVWQLRRNLVT